MSFTFEKLLVYQKSVDFADRVCAHTESFPRGYGFLVDQLNRAALSISTNIAEGNGRFTQRDRRNSLASHAAQHRSACRSWNCPDGAPLEVPTDKALAATCGPRLSPRLAALLGSRRVPQRDLGSTLRGSSGPRAAAAACRSCTHRRHARRS